MPIMDINFLANDYGQDTTSVTSSTVGYVSKTLQTLPESIDLDITESANSVDQMTDFSLAPEELTTFQGKGNIYVEGSANSKSSICHTKSVPSLSRGRNEVKAQSGVVTRSLAYPEKSEHCNNQKSPSDCSPKSDCIIAQAKSYDSGIRNRTMDASFMAPTFDYVGSPNSGKKHQRSLSEGTRTINYKHLFKNNSYGSLLRDQPYIKRSLENSGDTCGNMKVKKLHMCKKEFAKHDSSCLETPPTVDGYSTCLSPPSVKKLSQQFESERLSSFNSDQETFFSPCNGFSPLLQSMENNFLHQLSFKCRHFPVKLIGQGVASEPRNNTHSYFPTTRQRAESDPNQLTSRRKSIRNIPAIVKKLRKQFERQKESVTSNGLNNSSRVNEGYIGNGIHETVVSIDSNPNRLHQNGEISNTIDENNINQNNNESPSGNEVIKSGGTDWTGEIGKDPGTPSVRYLKEQFEMAMLAHSCTKTSYSASHQRYEFNPNDVEHDNEGQETPTFSIACRLRQFEFSPFDDNEQTSKTPGKVVKKKLQRIPSTVTPDSFSCDSEINDFKDKLSFDVCNGSMNYGNEYQPTENVAIVLSTAENIPSWDESEAGCGSSTENGKGESEKLAKDYRESEKLDQEREKRVHLIHASSRQAGPHNKKREMNEENCMQVKLGEREKERLEEKRIEIVKLSADLLKEQKVGNLVNKFTGMQATSSDFMKKRDSIRPEDTQLDIKQSELKVGQLIEKFVRNRDVDIENHTDISREHVKVGRRESDVALLIEKFTKANKRRHSSSSSSGGDSTSSTKVAKEAPVMSAASARYSNNFTNDETVDQDDTIIDNSDTDPAADCPDTGKGRLKLRRRNSDVALLIDKFTSINRVRHTSSSSHSSGGESSESSSKHSKENAPALTGSTKILQGKVRHLHADELDFFGEGKSTIEPFVRSQSLRMKSKEELPADTQPFVRSQSLRSNKKAPLRRFTRGESLKLKKSDSCPARPIPKSCRKLYPDELGFFGKDFNSFYGNKISDNQIQDNYKSDSMLNRNMNIISDNTNHNKSFESDSDSDCSILRDYETNEECLDEITSFPNGHLDLGIIQCPEDKTLDERCYHSNLGQISMLETIEEPPEKIDLGKFSVEFGSNEVKLNDLSILVDGEAESGMCGDKMQYMDTKMHDSLGKEMAEDGSKCDDANHNSLSFEVLLEVPELLSLKLKTSTPINNKTDRVGKLMAETNELDNGKIKIRMTPTSKPTEMNDATKENKHSSLVRDGLLLQINKEFRCDYKPVELKLGKQSLNTQDIFGVEARSLSPIERPPGRAHDTSHRQQALVVSKAAKYETAQMVNDGETKDPLNTVSLNYGDTEFFSVELEESADYLFNDDDIEFILLVTSVVMLMCLMCQHLYIYATLDI